MNKDFTRLSSINQYFHTLVENKNLNQNVINDNEIDKIISLLEKKFSNHIASDKQIDKCKLLVSDISILKKNSNSKNLQKLSDAVKYILKNRVSAIDFSANKKTKNLFIKLMNKLSKLYQEKITSRINAQFYSSYDDKLKYHKNKKKVESLKKKLKALNRSTKTSKINKNKIEAYKKQISLCASSIKKYEQNQKKAAETRQAFATIGGKRVSLRTQDHINIDGVYLSVQEFKNKLKEIGVKPFSIEPIHLKNSSFPSSTGLMLEKSGTSKTTDKIFDALNDLNLFLHETNPKIHGAGWAKLEIEGTNKILLVSDEEALPFINEHGLQYNKESGAYRVPKELIPTEAIQEKTFQEQNPHQGGTVILGSGTKAVYEMTKREALAFLLRGVDVMMINYRGFGESEGVPSTQGTYHDIEAAYQFVKHHTGIDDSKIIAKGLCLSGGIMAELARKHPKINLFLDQTYGEFHSIVKNQMRPTLMRKLNMKEEGQNSPARLTLFKSLFGVVSRIIKIIEPRYTVLKGLEKIEGKVFILESRQDLDTPQEEELKMLNVLRKHKKLTQTKIVSIPGKHAAQWVDAIEFMNKKGEVVTTAIKGEAIKQYTGRNQVNRLLKNINMFNPLF